MGKIVKRIYTIDKETDNKVLHKKSKKLSKADFGGNDIIFLKQFMDRLCGDEHVAGVAASQLGFNYRLFAVASKYLKTNTTLENSTIFANFEIVRYSEETDVQAEGCLSCPDVTCMVERSLAINAVWQDLNQKLYHYKFTGFPARILQHEADHNNGILIIDKAKLQAANAHLEETFNQNFKELENATDTTETQL